MRTARSLPYGGGVSAWGSLSRGVSVREPPWQRPPVRNMEPETGTPPEGIWDQAARQEVTSETTSPCEQNDRQV